MKSEIEQAFKLLEKWLSTKGFILFRSNHKKINDEVDFDRNIVFITKRSTPLHQFYSALHECGHIIIRKRKDYQEKYKASINYNENMSGKLTLRCHVEEIEEEINAWREGEKLCKKLNISLDTDKYYTYSARWVMSYIVKAGLGKQYLLGEKYRIEKVVSSYIEKNILSPQQPLDSEAETCYTNLNHSSEPKDQ